MLLVDRESMRFMQIWTSHSTGELVQRTGTVGRASPVVELPPGAADPSALFIERGFEPLPEGGWAQLVVQWPMNSISGTIRDRLFLDRAREWLEHHLDERGLGYCTGFDRGQRKSPYGGFVQNLFFEVVDGPLAATAAMTCLRTTRNDPTRASIAHRETTVDANWILRYRRTAARLPGEFAL